MTKFAFEQLTTPQKLLLCLNSASNYSEIKHVDIFKTFLEREGVEVILDRESQIVYPELPENLRNEREDEVDMEDFYINKVIEYVRENRSELLKNIQ